MVGPDFRIARRAVRSKRRIRAAEWNGRALWRQLLLVLALAAFAQANYLTQTHIHLTPAITTGQTGHQNSPPRDDPAHCPLCQEFLVAGAYLAPAPIILPLPADAALPILFFTCALPFVVVSSHAWRGRAPPLH
jgi:hypothetical protein